MIRRCQPQDARLLADVHQQCFTEGWSPAFFSDLVQRPSVLAFAALTPHESELKAAVVLQGVDPEKDILTLMTAPSFRGQGWAQAVLHHALDMCRSQGVQEIFLEVAADNLAALGVYQKFGFEQLSCRSKYYKRSSGLSVDALVMRYRLLSSETQ